MTLQEYYDALARHDWFYQYSDDHSVWKRGQAEWERLQRAQDTSPEHAALFSAWFSHAFFQGPVPPRPE